MRSSMMLTLMGLATACSGDAQIVVGGTPTELMFPFDGQRSWEYRSTDDNVPYQLVGTMLDESESIDGQNVYTINYTKDCFRDENCEDEELVFALRMSNYSPNGVFINGYDPGTGNVNLDPPLLVAEREVRRAEPVETVTAGITFSSEFIGPTSCDDHIVITTSWTCNEFLITGDAPLFPITGTFHAVNSQGLVAFQFTDEVAEWQLLSAEAIDADGVW
jgi:hypothetical protein